MRFALLALAAYASQLPAQAPFIPESAQMMRDVRILAADSMEGRRIGTLGNARARDYLVCRLLLVKKNSLASGFANEFMAPWVSGATIRGVNLLGIVHGTRYPDDYFVL